LGNKGFLKNLKRTLKSNKLVPKANQGPKKALGKIKLKFPNQSPENRQGNTTKKRGLIQRRRRRRPISSQGRNQEVSSRTQYKFLKNAFPDQ